MFQPQILKLLNVVSSSLFCWKTILLLSLFQFIMISGYQRRRLPWATSKASPARLLELLLCSQQRSQQQADTPYNARSARISASRISYSEQSTTNSMEVNAVCAFSGKIQTLPVSLLAPRAVMRAISSHSQIEFLLDQLSTRRKS